MSVEPKRINKYLADKGLCSRREADELIQKGWVLVNGEVLKNPGYKVLPTDKVTVKDSVQKHLRDKLTIIIHKPIGYVSAQAEGDYKPAIRLVTKENFHGGPNAPRIRYDGFAPAGRLDIDSTGLLILTQNGKLAKTIIAPDSNIEKEYIVKVEGRITKDKIERLRFGLKLDGKSLKRAQVEQVSENTLNFILIEGKKRQIRRMCELVDLKVTALKRIRIGKIELGKLPIGKWRLLKNKEFVD